ETEKKTKKHKKQFKKKKKNFQAGCQCTSKPLPGPCRYMKDTVSSSQSRHFSLSLNHHVMGERERSSPLPEIVQSRFLHLRNSQGSARPECNGRASPWANNLLDHCIAPAR